MNILIPVAKDKTGDTVTPTCSKEEGPFTCLGCSKRLILKQGEIKRWHFAHHVKDNTDCGAGGESYNHLAAKMILVKYMDKIKFVSNCKKGNHKNSRVYSGCTSEMEYRYDGKHSADVAVFQDGNLEAIVEVMVSHKTTGESLFSRTSRVGIYNTWEVDANDILKKQQQLTGVDNIVTVNSILENNPCIHCKQEEKIIWDKMNKIRQVELEAMKTQREAEMKSTLAHLKRKREQEMEEEIKRKNKPERVNISQNVDVKIVDENTIIRGDIRMNKVFSFPDSGFDRSYEWFDS